MNNVFLLEKNRTGNPYQPSGVHMTPRYCDHYTPKTMTQPHAPKVSIWRQPRLAFGCLAAGVLSLGYSMTAQAQILPDHGFLAAGAGVAPTFEGTDNYHAIPFIAGKLQWYDKAIALRGSGLWLDMNANSSFEYGPILNWRTKRNSSDGNGKIKHLSDVKAAIELGGFLGYRFGGNPQTGQGQFKTEISGLHDINNAYDGFLISGRLSYAALRERKTWVDVDIESSWANKGWQRAYYGVSRSNARRSGLSHYRPGSGFRNVTVGTNVGYQFNDSWGVMARASLTRLLDESEDSPIAHEGAKTTVLLGAAGTYRF